jgi:hypothetical protein
MEADRANWAEATADDLRRGVVFRFDGEPESKSSVVTSRWDEDGEVKVFSRNVVNGRPDGRSALKPDSPVLTLL